MNQLFQLIAKSKYSRYSAFILSGVLVGSWLGNQYPAQTAAFWGQPLVGLAVALAGLWSGHASTQDWKAKVEEALKTEPPK
jgi:hypothetical protein